VCSVDEHFPEIPVDFRPDLINVAMSAARYIAGIDEVAHTFVSTSYPTDAERDNRAARSLTSWRMFIVHASALTVHLVSISARLVSEQTA